MMFFIIAFTSSVTSLLYGFYLGESQSDRKHVAFLKEHTEALQTMAEAHERREKELQGMRARLAELMAWRHGHK